VALTGSAKDTVARVVDASSLEATPGSLSARTAEGSSVLLGFGQPEADGPVESGTVMYAASLAKQVIGMLLSLQVESGVLDVEGTLGRSLDDLPDWAQQIRVRHLIHHTSALPVVDRVGPEVGNDLVLDRLRGCDRLAAKPGVTFAYSNVGYVCLAEILSRLTGQPVAALARASLFSPLGMESTTLGYRPDAVRAGHALPPATVGDGGLWTTAEDLLRWNDAMNAGFFGLSVHARAETPGTLDDGTPLDYAWGVRVLDHRGRRVLSHGGSWPTWSAKTVRQPDQGLSVAILTSSEDAQAITATALEILVACRSI